MRFRAINLVAIVFMMIFTYSVIAVDIDENTMALWSFNDAKDDIIKDLSGRGHDLEIQGGHEWIAGKFGTALFFEIDAFIEYEAHPDLSFEDGLTIELWLNLEDIDPQEVVGIPRKENEYVLAAYEQGDGFYMGPWLNNGAWVGPANSTVVVPYGEWHYHAITYDGNEIKVYVDGEETGSMEIPGPLNATDAPFKISNSCCGGRFFIGAIDDMRISNVPRTEEEINNLMISGIDGMLSVNPSDALPSVWGYIKNK
ncbi:hypothetical protein GF312_00965 [Candidatus Poribacteria bacterium]|nr:hypothetical protein [Candidatus Poribacteria bacterium]